MANIVKDLGAVSAYAIAVEHGFEGTEQEFAELLNNSAANAKEAKEAAQATNASAEAAKNSAEAAKNSAEAAERAEERAEEVKKSIPQDYEALTNNVGSLFDEMAKKAPSIVDTMNGTACTTDVAADMPLQGLTLYGKTEQNGTPIPETPVPLVNAGEGGSIVVTVQGKNMLPDNVVSTGAFVGGAGNVYTAKSTGNALIATVRLFAGVTYTLSQRLVSGTGALPCMIIRKQDGTNIAGNYANSNNPVTYTATDDLTVDIRLQSQANGTETTVGDSYAVMLEVGNTATAFEPYKDGGSMTVNTHNGLPGIPAVSGGNYTDENGQQWICDEIDLERGVYTQNAKTVKLTSDMNWQYSTATKRFYVAIENAKAEFSHLMFNGLCTHYPAGTAKDDVCVSYVNENIGGVAIADNSRFNGNMEAFKTFLNSNNVEVVVQLGTPIETTIPAEELAAYRALRTIAPNTTVYNDAGAGMIVKYAADTKGYIDKKIAAIAAAVL